MLGWAVKMYSIHAEDRPIDRPRFEGVVPQVLSALPSPAIVEGRVGVAILILHQGRGVDYAVLAWWDRENELPLRVFVSEGGKNAWRAARGSESICVWDMEVLWGERQLYVRNVMGHGSDVTGYAHSVIDFARAAEP